MRAAFGELARWDEPESAFLLALGPYGVRVRISTTSTGVHVIDIYTWLARGLEVTPTLAMWLLARNARLRFGSLALDRDGDIVLAHALLPSSLADDGLPRAIELLTLNADELERELRERS